MHSHLLQTICVLSRVVSSIEGVSSDTDYCTCGVNITWVVTCLPSDAGLIINVLAWFYLLAVQNICKGQQIGKCPSLSCSIFILLSHCVIFILLSHCVLIFCRSYDDFAKKLRNLPDLPLTIHNIQGISAVFRYAEVIQLVYGTYET